MNKSRQTPFKTLAYFLCLISVGWVFGQSESKTFNETFVVTDDTVLDINTSHADIEFETWDKDQVSIEAIIELEDATTEEAERYFERENFEIVGNSKRVTIKTETTNSWHFDHTTSGLHDMLIDIPEINIMEPFPFELHELQEMPELPFMEVPQFDYQAYEADKEEYMKKWQKEFEKGLGKDYPKRMEEWGKKMEVRQQEREERRSEMMEEREEAREKRLEKMEEVRAKSMERRAEAMEKRKEALLERKTGNSIFISRNGDDSEGPNVFYFSSDGENKNYKVKKTIKVKMPKGMKIKMNVRHGEVKLAENTKNMNAILSHSSLWATTIDGDKTTIIASYSPVNVQKWNFGALQADYSESVKLKEVLNLRLNSTSSNVTIDKLLKTAFIKNDFGPLVIKSVSKDFTDLDISLQNAELDCKMPNTAFMVYVNGTSSTLNSPTSFQLERTTNHNNVVHKGYFGNKDANKSLVINSKYSEVTID